MDFFLDFELCKAVSGEENDGNYIFQVEASNENVDFQDQVVLQEALLKSKDNFLKNGVISYDHLHRRKDQDGNMISDPSMIIGEPIDVWTVGNKTFVKGILYKANEMAQEVVKLLKSGSTRIRASVGGLFPKVVKGKDGVEKIVSVLWNDLALTPCPVNNTVGAASFAKSFTPETFARALAVGVETDSAAKTGGASFSREDLDRNDKDVVQEEDDVEESADEVLKSLLGMIEKGVLNDKIGIYDFLVSKGIDKEESWAAAHEIDNALGGYNSMARKAGGFAEKVRSLVKSIGSEDNADEMEKAEDEEKMELGLEVKDDEGEGEVEVSPDDKDDDEMKKGKSCKKSYIDATDLLKSLSDDLSVIRKENEELRKSLLDLGDAVVEVAKTVAKNSSMVKSFGEEPVGIRSKMEKSAGAASVGSKDPMTQSDFKWAQGVLVKAVKDGEIDIAKSAMIERDMQLAMATPGYQMNPEYYNFLSKKFAGGN